MVRPKFSLSLFWVTLISLVFLSSNCLAETWHGIGITTDISWDSGDYGGGDTINTYSGTITIDYSVTPRFTLSLSIVPYVYQDETYTDVVLVRKRVVHYKDKYGTNPHHKRDAEAGNDGAKNHTNNNSTGSSGDSDSSSGTSSKVTQDGGSTGDHHDSRHTKDSDSQNHSKIHDKTHNTTGNTETSGVDDSHDTTDTSHADVKNSGSSKSKDSKDKISSMKAQSRGNDGSAQGDKAGKRSKPKRKRYRRHGSAGGFGDMTLKASYYVLNETDIIPLTALKAGVKFPTADEDDGLGTGEFDYLFGMDLSKEVGRWSLFGGVCYNILGDPDYYDLNNYVSGYAGVSTEVLPNFYTSLEVDAAGAASDESDSELSLGLELGYDFGKYGYLAAGASKGFSDGSPDYGAYVSYSISF